MRAIRGLAKVLPLTFAAACASGQGFDRSTEPGEEPHASSVEVRVLTEADLSINSSWTLLDALRNSIPGTKIQQMRGGDCPIILLRGQDTVDSGRPSNPDVYVDGTHTSDTCPLVSIQAAQARRMEIYPLGYSGRAGYAGGAHGLILVFLRRADADTAQSSQS